MAGSERTGRPCTFIARTQEGSASIAARAAATPWRSTPAPQPHSSAICSVYPTITCCGFITCRGAIARVGRPLWDELVHRYTHGVDVVREMRKTWDELAPPVDAERHGQVAAFLRIQEEEAKWWRDACVAYFQSISHRPIPSDLPSPEHPLDYYKALEARMHPATRLCVFACLLLRRRCQRRNALHPVFQDHVVLQRDKPINVWGEALPREALSVSLSGRTASVQADERGRWHATLPAVPAGGLASSWCARSPGRFRPSATCSSAMSGCARDNRTWFCRCIARWTPDRDRELGERCHPYC